ncbi:hypothetical protein [Caballeronia calidae]|uniref:hypothetical protein n=1 Tax=Caballeronia calidae TaxID=1777139 RepID=UPI0009ED2982
MVTGAGSGIGAGIARAFANVGGHVALVDRKLSAADIRPTRRWPVSSFCACGSSMAKFAHEVCGADD